MAISGLRDRERDRDRQTDRETDRHTDRDGLGNIYEREREMK